MSSQKAANRACILRLNDARASGDVEQLRKLVSDDVTLRPPAELGFAVFRGSEDVVHVLAGRMLQRVLGAEPLRRDVLMTIVDDHAAVVIQRLRGVFEDGSSYDNEYAWVYEFDGDGQIDRITEYTDTLRAERSGLLDRLATAGHES